MNLLIGATGFVGGHLVEHLFQQNEISRATFRKGAHLKILDLNGVQGIEADLLDHHSLHEAMEGIETVYSMASPTPWSNDSDFDKVNIEGISNLLEVAQEMKVKTIVHLSTLEVYGFGAGTVGENSVPRPGNQYQRSKLEADRTLLEFAERSTEPRIVIIRAARAVGSRDASLTVPLLTMIEAGSISIPSSGKMSFTHPKDIAEAMFKAATNQVVKSKVHLIKSFDASPPALVTSLAETMGRRVNVKVGGLFSRSALSSYAKEQLKSSPLMETNSSWTEIGYAPKFGLKETCEEIAAWYKKDPWATEQE